MKNIFNQLDANAPSHFNGFDLSQRHIHSAKVGQIIPVASFSVMPKDYFDFDVLSLVRSMPINTAAFARMSVRYTAAFIPFQQLWHSWNQFYLQQEERMSLLDDNSLASRIPHFELNSFLFDVGTFLVYFRKLTNIFKERGWNGYNYANELPAFKSQTTYDRFGYFLIKLFRNIQQYPMINPPAAIGFDPFLLGCDEQGFARIDNSLRLIDMLGYGSFYEQLECFADILLNRKLLSWDESTQRTVLDNFASHEFTSVDEERTYIDNIVLAEWQYYTALKEDMLNQSDPLPWYNDEIVPELTHDGRIISRKPLRAFVDFDQSSSPSTTIAVLRKGNINPFRFLAYQKYWQDFVMNKRVQPYDPSYFNIDGLESVDYNTFFKISSMRYEMWPYDMFTGLFPSPQTGEVSLVSGDASIIFRKPDGSDFENLGNSVNARRMDDRSLARLSLSSISDAVSSIVGPSVYDIKRAEFLQRWKENHLRAGYKLQNQALGQWNTRFKYLAQEYCEFLHSWDLPVNIDEVINTAENQGDISGKGISTGNSHFTYTATDAGVIMIFLSVVPRPEYDSVMIDKDNTCFTIDDYPSPFFDNLGLESVPAYLLNFMPTGNLPYLYSLGYGPRYLPWKTAIDKVHGEFMSFRSPSQNAGQFAIWAAPRRELEDINIGVDINRFFYVSPHVVDTIFAASADSTQSTDHFLFNNNVVCRVVRNLSVSGQLGWNV